ncbi:beta-1,4-N-acetylgalactosaminyltransferase 3 [Anguilla rostrata]|uniref:beta-1,4-N-acetylgalactosaminyltransferase 3 n=1 Tax=Anguilla rostrata TaxID=7938 RepID=UPI0030D288CE
MMSFFPLKKLRRNVKYLLFGAVLIIGVLAAYLEFVATTNTWNDSVQFNAWDETTPPTRQATEKESLSSEQGRSWQSQFTPQSWSPEHKGQANLHIFEDWCGSSTLQLRKNLHFPLYPHSRTTVTKLAVSPRWTNYGLRIFGYLHPYVDGEFLFAVASDDNSEFWLSEDDSPLNLHLLALVGKTGAEWAAPGEFGKYVSQVSQPVELLASKQYYFEILHKQNDRGTDHVEVAWRLHDGERFTVIDSRYISLYTNESARMMSEVAHIPQSAASHVAPPQNTQGTPKPGDSSLGVDMLREDPRDSLYQIPLVDRVHVRRVLPDCAYEPSYIIKGFPLLRYQGLQFVHMSYVYPNDYTRLTHMETENKCFYHENPYYLDRFGFFKYMKMDIPKNGGLEDRGRLWKKQGIGLLENISLDEIFQYANQEIPREPKFVMGEGKAGDRPDRPLDYGDDYDDYAFKRKRKLFSAPLATEPAPHRKRKRRGKAGPQEPRTGPAPRPDTAQEAEPLAKVRSGVKSDRGARGGQVLRSRLSKPDSVLQDKGTLLAQKVQRVGVVKLPGVTADQSKRRLGSSAPVTTAKGPSRIKGQTSQPTLTLKQTQATAPPGQEVTTRAFSVSTGTRLEWQLRGNVTSPLFKTGAAAAKSQPRKGERRTGLRGNEVDPVANRTARREEEAGPGTQGANESEADSDRLWTLGNDLEGDGEGAFDATKPPIFDQAVNWRQTFDVEPLDFHALRSDWIDLTTSEPVDGALPPSLSLPLSLSLSLSLSVPRRFSLSRVVNVEKRADGSQGSRYFLELELLEEGVGRVRLSRYIYALQRRRRGRGRGRGPGARRGVPLQQEPLLCTPLGFSWDPSATVHFIVPVKNQARWVQQFITDMERLYRDTGDSNFNIIITDYSSTDMDVEEVLKTSALPRYQYLKLNGNFERSAGLQAGVDLITDDHSIVFLCDLHIHFPPFIIDSVRKHCVEGRMAFAPIVMRLDCGATPREPKGFWEVNGFGLLGIYKSDLDAAGGMNTRDFRDRWGGEDWELLDRILQAGLEVERIHLRNFMHHYHSKRGMWNRQPLKAT